MVSSCKVDQGLINAQYNLGLMYAYGKRLDKDPIKAIKLYQLAAEQGDLDTQCNLGLMYAYGKGVSQADKKTAKWFQLAIEQDNKLAQGELDMFLSKKSLFGKIKDIF